MSFKSSRRGVPAIRARREAALGAVSYPVKVLGYGPIAYWPLWETAGATAQCLVNSAQNGAYTGVTLANAAGPDGSPCPFFDGANDYVNVMTAAFAGAGFNEDLHTVMIWARVNAVGTWTDGSLRSAWDFTRDGNNQAAGRKSNANNRIAWWSTWGGAGGTRNHDGLTEVGWMNLTLTRSQVAGQTLCYYNGAQVGAAIATPNVAAGNVVSAFIGASAGPNFHWHGWLAHCAVWDTVLTPAQIADLAAV